MTLSTTDSRFVYDGDASTTAFSFPRKVIEASHLIVYLYDEDDDSMSLQTLNTHYTFAGASLSNGIYASATLTFVTAPGTDKKVIIYRDPTLTNEFDFNAETNVLNALNRYSDRVEMKLQRVDDRLDRAFVLPEGDYATALTSSYAKADWANKAFYFDSSGNPVPTTPSGVSGTEVTPTGGSVARTLALWMADAAICFSTYAEMTAATYLVDNAIYYVYARATEEDGGAGFFRYDSGSSATADSGSILAATIGGRLIRLHDGIARPEWFGSSAAWGAAITLAAVNFTCVRLTPGSTYSISDSQIVISKNNFVLDCRGAIINSTYASDYAFKFGTGSTQYQNNMVIGGQWNQRTVADGGATQGLFDLRGQRNFTLRDCQGVNIYQLLRWGAPADSQVCFKLYHINCDWTMRLNASGGHTHAMLWDGSSGGYYGSGEFFGGDSANVSGTQAVARLTSAQGPARFDHMYRTGGNWKGFDYGIHCVDARLVNVDWDPSARTDDMQVMGFYIEASSGASKGGCEDINLRGGFHGLGPGGVLHLKDDKGGLGFTDVVLSEAHNNNATGTVVKLETSGSGAIANVHIDALHIADYNPSDANQDAIILDGDIDEFSINTVSLDGKSGATYTARRVVYDNTAATKKGRIGPDIWGDVNSAVVYRANIGTTTGRHIHIRQDGTPSIVVPGHISGLTLANGTDATNDIDFTAGKCADSTNTVLISCAAMTKQLDAAWAVGSAAGGLDGGSIANATYHCHAISKDTTGVGDFIYSLSHDKSAVVTMTIASPAVVTMTAHGLVANSPFKFSTTGALPTGVTAGTLYYVISTGLTADAFQFSASIGGAAVNSSGTQSGVHTCLPGPAMPSGYTHFRRIGSIIRSGATILAFTQRGDEFLLKVPVAAADSATPGTSAISKVLQTPIGIQTDAIVTSGGVDLTAAAATYGLVTPLDLTDTTPTSALFNWSIAAAGAVPNSAFANLRVRTDTAASIRLRVDASTADLTLKTITHGWVDARGRLR